MRRCLSQCVGWSSPSGPELRTHFCYLKTTGVSDTFDKTFGSYQEGTVSFTFKFVLIQLHENTR